MPDTDPPEPDHPGFVVVALNAHGVAEAFGPFDEDVADRHAAFMARLVPTWFVDLAEGSAERYGLVEEVGPRPESLSLPDQVAVAAEETAQEERPSDG